MIEFIFNGDHGITIWNNEEVSILVLIEFIFNLKDTPKGGRSHISLNPCFDRIYFQLDRQHGVPLVGRGLNPCFDRIYFQFILTTMIGVIIGMSQSLF